ncbi:adhesion G-protein coupled receptor G6-like [Diaphorina citri]|uniref:Adhesion G-protein coupled receptor G6-like n=1 Tax=Diaphorina citri TaxID=121845 RepID=A0A1S3DFT0_DIACI|nr:adhesion G-protein coupled receptor G6-like [Diaphorina citri]
MPDALMLLPGRQEDVGSIPDEDSDLCLSIAFALHYLHAAVFTWLLLMVFNMNRDFRDTINIVPTLDPNITRTFVKYSLFGWGFPLVLLAFAFFLQWENTDGQWRSTQRLQHFNCWFLNDSVFFNAFATPVCTLVFLKLYYICKSYVTMKYCVSLQVDAKMKEKMKKKRTLQICLYLKMISVVTTILFLSIFVKITKSSTIWIMFNIAHSLQGILIVIIVTCDSQVMNIYTHTMKIHKNTFYNSMFTKRSRHLSRSASLQMLTWEPLPDAI